MSEDGVSVEAALLGHQVHDFREEERVALGLLVDAGDELASRLAPGRRREVGAHLRFLEAVENHTLESALAIELGERLGERMGARQLGVAVGADDEQAHVRELAREVLEKQQRRLVRPVDVVEHDHQRRALGGGAQEAGVGVEEPELRRTRRRQPAALRLLSEDARQLREQANQLTARALQHLGERGDVVSAPPRPPDLHPWPVGRRA